MAPKQPPIVLPPNLTLEKLVPVQQLLHLTVQRNKNQHRITKWWGNLQVLRRNVKRLVETLSSKEAEYRRGKEALLKLSCWIETEIIPRTYLSFSAVVADNQYASLGLMLIGCLARVNSCVSFPRSRLPSQELEVKVESSRMVIPSEDMGEAITREEEKLQADVLEEARAGKKNERRRRREMLEDERGESVSRDVSEMDARPRKAGLKREVLDVERSSEEDQRQPAKKVKKVSRKFMEEFDHLSGNSSSEEEPVPKKVKKVKKVAKATPTEKETSGSEEQIKPVHKRFKKQRDTSDSEEEIKPVLKKVKNVAPSSKAAKPAKKKKKKGGDDFDDLFAGLM